MTVIINKDNANNTSKILVDRINKTKKTGNLNKHFGKLKRNIDGLDFQKKLRKDEH